METELKIGDVVKGCCIELHTHKFKFIFGRVRSIEIVQGRFHNETWVWCYWVASLDLIDQVPEEMKVETRIPISDVTFLPEVEVSEEMKIDKLMFDLGYR